jgi:hypothetical protein
MPGGKLARKFDSRLNHGNDDLSSLKKFLSANFGYLAIILVMDQV